MKYVSIIIIAILLSGCRNRESFLSCKSPRCPDRKAGGQNGEGGRRAGRVYNGRYRRISTGRTAVCIDNRCRQAISQLRKFLAADNEVALISIRSRKGYQLQLLRADGATKEV